MPNYNMALQYHQAAADATGRKEHVFVASDGSLMRSRRRINPDGWDLEEFRLNPIVLENHAWMGLPVGRARVWVADARLWAAVTFARTARGQEIEALVDDGILRGASVGWTAEDADVKVVRDGPELVAVEFNRQKLVELSVVTVPDNVNALKVARAQAEEISAAFAEIANLKEYLWTQR